ncbi:MAG: TlpA disulfide reductase family protein [Polyangiaceae bacterium]
MTSRRAVFGLMGLSLGLMVACGPAKPANVPEGGGSSNNAGDGGKKAPEVAGVYVGGDGPATIADAAGQVIIVDFWATYCEPCKKSFPMYQELVDKHAGAVVVIGVSVDDPEDVSQDDIKAFATELNVTFPIVWDKEHKTAEAYKPPKMPTSYVIDKSGNIRHVHSGYSPSEAEEIANEVDELLK